MLLLIDKIPWITSQDAISAVKKALREPYRNALSDEEKLAGVKPAKIKIWHSWTLDPMASWLLIAATDKETKQLHHLTGLDKSYIATIDFSIITDTWDTNYRKEYKVIPLSKGGRGDQNITESTISSLLSSLIGTHKLPLTPFSAKKVNGKKLYEYAREWNPIFLTVPMSIHGFEILDYQFPLLTLRLDVWSGTYIRSIAHRLGNQFDLGGTLTMLRRTQIGEYTLDQITDNNKEIALWDEKEIPYHKL